MDGSNANTGATNGKLKVAVDDVTIDVNDAGKLTMKYNANAPMKYGAVA